jgi:aminomethyltransferase
MTEPERIYHLALRDLHTAAGATFDVRDGWSVPAVYTEAAAEYRALRERGVVFDRSARSRVLLNGTDAVDVLEAVFAGHVRELEEGRAMRTVALDSSGNIRELALIARTGGISYMVAGEPGQRFETLERLQAAVGPDFDVRIDDRTETTCMVALAGPAAAELAREHLSDALPARLQNLHCVTFEFHGFRTLAMRTSDTGEDGFEFMVAPAVAQHVIETLGAAGVPLAGAFALDCARVEACVPAFAPDLETGLSPAEADLDVLLDVPAGREGRTLAALLIEAEEPPPAGTELRQHGTRAGEVRSSLWSFGLNATVALGIIDIRAALPGREFEIDGARATVVAKPFFRRRQQ